MLNLFNLTTMDFSFSTKLVSYGQNQILPYRYVMVIFLLQFGIIKQVTVITSYPCNRICFAMKLVGIANI